MTILGINIAVGNPIYQRRGSPPVITATTAPTLSALTDAQTPADGYTAGSYTSTAGTIASAVETYYVNDVEVASTYDLAADDDVRVSVLVTDSVGNTRTFSTGTVTVTAAASGADYIVTNDAEWDAAISSVTTGQIIEVQGSNFTRRTITGSGFTIRGADASAELPEGIRFEGTVDGVTVRDIILSRQQEAEGPPWGSQPYTLYGLATYGNSTALSDLTFDGVTFDGGLAPFADGGRITTNTSFMLQGVNGFTVRNCTMQRVFTALYLDGSSNGIVEDNVVTGQHADAFVLMNYSGDCQDIIIRNNHVQDYAGDASNLHMDVVQFQPSDNLNYIRRIEIYGNTSTPGDGPFIAQADDFFGSNLTYNEYTSSFTIGDSESGMETRCSPASGGSMTVTLPPAAASLGKQFTLRQRAVGTVNVALDGADTWEGGTPGMSAIDEWNTFVSDGTSQWKKLRPGFRTWFLLCTASRTLSTVEEKLILNVDATDGDIDITLPAGGTASYTIRRIDGTANTVRLLKDAGDTLSLRSSPVTSISFVQGYSVDVVGTAGAWAATEDGPTNQILFANQHVNRLYEDIKVYGNIHFNHSGVGFRLETSGKPEDASYLGYDGIRVYNNTYLWLLEDDQNGDGVVGRFEGNAGRTMDVDVRGADAQSWANITAGAIVLSSGGAAASDIDSIGLGLTTNVGAEATFDDYFNGITRAAYVPTTRAEVITAALARSGGALDGTYIGAAGTTASNGFYNFDAGQVNSGLPAPTLSGSSPLDEGSVGAGGKITLQFDQFVTLGTGNIVIRNVTDNTTVETFDAAAGTGNGGGTVTASGNEVVLTPGANLPDGKACSVQVASTAVVGHYGTAYAGIANDTTLNFTVDAALPTSFTTVTAGGGYLTRSSGLTGVSGTKQQVLIGFHGYRTGGDAQGEVIFLDGVRDIGFRGLATGETRWNAGTSSWRLPSSMPTTSAETILCSIDMTAADLATGVKFYRNGSKLTGFTSPSWTPGTDFDAASFTAAILNRTGGGLNFQGVVGFVYLDFPTTLPDLDDPAVRAKFAAGDLISTDGAAPTGAAPAVFIHGDASVWNAGTNLGTGGVFTPNGAAFT